MTLQENYAIRVEQYNPQMFRFDLAASYSVYEPVLNFGAEHSFNSSPGGVDPDGVALPSTEIENDAFSSSMINGFAPWGLEYSIGGAVSHRTFTPPGSDQYTGGASVDLRQPLLRDFWIDQRRATIRLAKVGVEISEAAYRDQLMRTLTAVEQAYYNLIFTIENVKVRRKALELAERLLMENKRRVEVGTMAPLDEQQALAEVATSRAQLIEAERALAVQQNILKNLMTDNYRAWHAVFLVPTETLSPVPPDLDLMESWRVGLLQRADLEQLRLDLDRRDIDLALRKNQLFPDLSVIGSYGHNALNTSYNRILDDITRDENPRYSYGVSLSIPLGNQNARARYRQAKVQEKQAELLLKQAEQNVLVQIDDAIKQAQSTFERAQATAEARRFAEAALDAEQKKLESGKSTSFFVLQFQRDLTEARFEEIRALAEYNNALAELGLARGTTLERHDLEVEFR